MPFQHLPTTRQTRYQARSQAVLTPKPRVPLDGIPEIPQRGDHLDRGPVMEGESPIRKEGRGPIISRSFSGVAGSFPVFSKTSLRYLGEDDQEEEENYVEEEDYEDTGVFPVAMGAAKGIGGSTPAQSNKTFSHQYEPSLLAIMQHMSQIMANLQPASSSEASRLYI
ncbi:hypothetical protein O181_094693 [Austropuccinia psidii MF-1]|uniref:Uncharacterized protein n=1 Tax=Austropuccinia psidii MF-1 TaxID=1389203 RepID=A0A9Q3J2I1_9BASI|nr:hypothetical protein [Austropuccinia psidii MF-1]